MTLWINNGKDGSPNKLGGDIDASSCRIEFTEAVYQLDSSGNFGTLTYVNTSSTDCKATSGGQDLKAGDIVQLKFTIKDYETEYAGKKTEKKVTPKQLKWHDVFTSQMALGSAFSGHINLTADLVTLDALITKKSPDGVDIPETYLAMMRGNGFSFAVVELDKLKDIQPSSGGNYGSKKTYAPAQTELQKLTDNLTFLESLETKYAVKLHPEQILKLLYKVDVTLDF